MRRLIVLASLLALVATACKIETNFGAVIGANGSGTMVAEVGMDEEAQGFLLTDTTDPFEGNDLAECEGARTREENRGDMKFWIIECDVDDITEFESMMSTSDNTFIQDFNITVTDTLVTVSGTASAEDTLGSEAEGFDPTVFEESISANLKITMPGRILEHNADSRPRLSSCFHRTRPTSNRSSAGAACSSPSPQAGWRPSTTCTATW